MDILTSNTVRSQAPASRPVVVDDFSFFDDGSAACFSASGNCYALRSALWGGRQVVTGCECASWQARARCRHADKYHAWLDHQDMTCRRCPACGGPLEVASERWGCWLECDGCGYRREYSVAREIVSAAALAAMGIRDLGAAAASMRRAA